MQKKVQGMKINSYLEKPAKKVCSISPNILIFETMLIWPVFWPVFQDMNF